jgi:hypothetical protein
MKLKEWGNAIWYLFHALAYKLKHEESHHANDLFAVIRRICANLPCPKCREHALRIVSKQRRVKDKAELERFLWKFHNTVNVSLKRREMSYEDYQAMYAKANTWRIVEHFIRTMRKNMRIPGLMLDSHHRQMCVTNFDGYIKQNRKKFHD